ncbi:hypothetical protein [Azospirillum sp. TSO22-1]|uniref:hypothetical protein n=1 Tax=Azospirillum sp. TSO22-1 TaxID=716789 RepID=UPI0011B79308|nr:hypothetical protein [Azospirillum sp. TSO22-1]
MCTIPPALLALALSGCVAGLMADAGSVGMSGKTLADHALDTLTGMDCRIVEGMTRPDRNICEPRGSLATMHDYKGFGLPPVDPTYEPPPHSR